MRWATEVDRLRFKLLNTSLAKIEDHQLYMFAEFEQDGSAVTRFKLYESVQAARWAILPYDLGIDAAGKVYKFEVGRATLWQRVKNSILLKLGFSPLRPPLFASLIVPNEPPLLCQRLSPPWNHREMLLRPVRISAQAPG